MNSNNKSLHSFRDMVSNIFRLTMAVQESDAANATKYFDTLLHLLTKTLEEQETERQTTASIALEANDTLLTRDISIPARIHPDVEEKHTVVLDLVKPAPVPVPMHVIKAEEEEEEAEEEEEEKEAEEEAVEEEAEAEEEAVEEEEEAVEAEEEEEEAVEEEEEAVEAEEEEEEAVEAEEEEEEAEEKEEEAEEEEEEAVEAEEEEEEAADEEEEGLVVIEIKKKKFFYDASSQELYTYVNDEEAGDCIGRYENGKIVPIQ